MCILLQFNDLRNNDKRVSVHISFLTNDFFFRKGHKLSDKERKHKPVWEFTYQLSRWRNNKRKLINENDNMYSISDGLQYAGQIGNSKIQPLFFENTFSFLQTTALFLNCVFILRG